MGDDGHAMQSLMGFSSFGRPRKRLRRGGGGSSGSAPLHHVVPGTAVEPSEDELPASRLRISPQGVASMLHPSHGHKLLSRRPSAMESGASADDDGAVAKWSLPAASMELLARLEATKARFEQLEPAAFAHARRRSNPFEPLGRHRFINRSAMKMANLDFLFQWTQRSCEDEPFVFADVCGGPGGFSEYLLWRLTGASETQACNATAEQQRTAVGFGITLKGAPWCDWKVTNDDKDSAVFHICDGADGTGDLYKLANIHSFRDTLRGKYPAGAQLVVADGGFPDARDQNCQEVLMTRLVLAETLTMFHVLRVGGQFVCKTFELSSPLMLQLVWLLHNCFTEIAIVKPVTSRPASSERYIVAQTLLPDLPFDAIQCDLARLVDALERRDPREEFLTCSLEAFPTARGLSACLAFVAQASDRHAKQQIDACEKIITLATPSLASDCSSSWEPRIDRDAYYRTWKL